MQKSREGVKSQKEKGIKESISSLFKSQIKWDTIQTLPGAISSAYFKTEEKKERIDR